jgi:hypothetical protein
LQISASAGELESNTVDFYIHEYDKDRPTLFSRFTIYNKDKIHFEWQANPEFVANDEGTWDINLKQLFCDDLDSVFLKAKIWHIEDNNMVIEFNNGIQVELNRLQ